MTALVYGIVYAGVLVFLVACVVRAVRYARLPSHLRWELYPVPHEEARRAEHGGSYFETVDWWTAPNHFNLAGELKVMVPEMLFLQALRENNRRLWLRSFFFHFGLYLLIGTVVLLFAGALAALLAPGAVSPLADVRHVLGLDADAFVAETQHEPPASLLRVRLTDPGLKNYTTPGDLFNLVFFIVTFGTLLVGYFMPRPEAFSMLAFAKGLLTFDTAATLPPVLTAGVILASLLAAYIPLTHMSHFIAKYFTYHSIRWDDIPAARSAEMRRRFAEYLTLRPTWAARHIGADGAKTWAEIATTNPFTGASK